MTTGTGKPGCIIYTLLEHFLGLRAIPSDLVQRLVLFALSVSNRGNCSLGPLTLLEGRVVMGHEQKVS